jgi:succinyldiaminopimelate transaminase
MAFELPDFPWDSLDPYRATAKSHPGGLIDLSVGSPVDDTPELARDALRSAANAPSYPLTAGSLELRSVIASWWERRRNTGPLTPEQVIPTLGSKEMVGLLPTLLGLGSGDTIVIPEIAYPTYAVGAMVAGAELVVSDDPASWPQNTRLIWLNSPGNPTGNVLGVSRLREAVARARELGALIVNDECYAEMPWTVDRVPSILDREVTHGDHTGILALYSTSKQSNLAGYRAAVLAGDKNIVDQLLAVRKHLGLISPTPIQAALLRVLSDDHHVQLQRERYLARRKVLLGALESTDLVVDHSEAGLYLWVSRGENCWDTVSWCAELGILVTPGDFYGAKGAKHVRIALTASDKDIAEAARRLQACNFVDTKQSFWINPRALS